MTITTSNNVRICENNLAELGGESNISVSSEQTSYPKENAVSRFRNEQWRPLGNFTIDSSNSALYIRVGATDTTIALTAGNYTYSTLASHVSSQLNTYSNSWTCSYDFSGGTFKFTIGRSSSAYLVFSSQTNAVWNTLGFLGTSDVLDTSFVADIQRNHTHEYIEFDFGYAADIKAFFCIGSLSETFSISANATALLRANNLSDETLWKNPPFEIDLSDYRSDAGIYVFLDSIRTDTRYRFYRLHIEDKENALGPEECIRVSNIYAGDYVYLENRNIQNGFTKTVFDPSDRSVSESGELYWDQKTNYTLIESIGFTFISKEDRATLESIFNKVGLYTPIYLSIDPNLEASDSLSDLTYYCVYNTSPTMQHVIRDKFNYSLSFREVI